MKYILKEIWLQIKFGEIFSGEVKIVALKGAKGKLFSRRPIIKANKWLLQMKNKYPNVQLHYLPDLPF